MRGGGARFVVAVVPLVALLARGASGGPAKKAPSPTPSTSTSASTAAAAPAQKSLSETLTGEAKDDFEAGAFAYKKGDY